MTEKKSKEKKSEKISCIALRKVGLEDRTCEVDEPIELDRDTAKRLQDVGAIKVEI